MSKYIPADKLRAEIERQKRENLGSPECVCDDILSFIDSLQQEPPEVDLEKEIDDYFLSIERWQVEDEPYRQLDKCARHFFELGKNSLK